MSEAELTFAAVFLLTLAANTFLLIAKWPDADRSRRSGGQPAVAPTEGDRDYRV